MRYSVKHTHLHMGLLVLLMTAVYSTWAQSTTHRYGQRIMATERIRNIADRFSNAPSNGYSVPIPTDDHDPSFVYQGCTVKDGACLNPKYYATVIDNDVAGTLQILPERIQAIDIDSMDAAILYRFSGGLPSTFRNFFEIDEQSGQVKQIRPVDITQTKRFEIIVKAEEQTRNRRSTTAKLTINVKPVDSHAPVILATSNEGFVDENSPIGTKVVDSDGKAIHISVTDPDLTPDYPKPDAYVFESTTAAFAVNNEGFLVVNQINLDRDPPSPATFRFQILAREKNGNASSSPIYLAVTLVDQNDNAPRIPTIPSITIEAGESRRQIAKIEAIDNDTGNNAIITYSIYHVSNNGFSKFFIDPVTGVLECTGKLSAGEQYSITVQATDNGGKFSQSIVEVTVVSGPSNKSPVFEQSVYDVIVSEGVPVGTSVTSVQASDPEKSLVSYSIIAGNDLREFSIDTKTGVITVVKKLDREQLTQYQLMIKAEDEDGLFSTTTVNIKISDINDKNPQFINTPYEFNVVEGVNGALVGRVKAVDADEGQNSFVYYSITDDVPFIVDANSGEIRTTISLNYEKQSEYKFTVAAKDGGLDSRLAMAPVTVKVIDVEDEVPIFHVPQYEVEVQENVADVVVAQVNAHDPDSTKKVTYIVRQGPTDLFVIDPISGEIRTKKGLDHEKEGQHILIIGTEENPSTKPGATTKVVINVKDVNDIPPIFVSTPQPVTLDDNVPIGTKVTTLLATDSDGTSPNNKIRYEIVGRGKAAKYFQIDPDLGVLQVRNDLRKEPINEYQVDVKATDLGDPRLSSIVSLFIFIVRHETIVPSGAGVEFAEDAYIVRVAENSIVNSSILSLPIVNSTNVMNAGLPLKCTIISDNSENVFYTNFTSDGNCQVRIKEAKLDHEHKNEYDLKIRLDSVVGVVNPAKSIAKVKVIIIDENDSTPRFIYPESSKRFAKSAYHAAIGRDTPISSPVIQIKAVDLDQGPYGDIEYCFLKEDPKLKNYFIIDLISGLIRTNRNFEGINENDLPFRLVVEARDNPGQGNKSNSETTDVIINLIDDRHRMILVIADAPTDTVKNIQDKIIELLEEHAKLLIGIEKITAKQFKKSYDNSTLETDPNSTDLWFYAIDPDTGIILERNNSRVFKSIWETEAASNITLDVSGNLHLTASNIHAPLEVISPKTAGFQLDGQVFPYLWLLIGILILIFSIIAMIYICQSWSRYKAYKDRMARMCATPRYDPVFVDPNLKEYETQVLQMSVPPTDDSDSLNDLQLDFSSKNHSFNLDNVQYISKDHGNQSPTNSDTATTRESIMSEPHGTLGHNGTMGRINRAYQRSTEEDSPSNFSAVNDNVVFREKRDYSHMGYNYIAGKSPIETTTEL